MRKTEKKVQVRKKKNTIRVRGFLSLYPVQFVSRLA